MCVWCVCSCVLGRPRSEFLQVPVGRSCGWLGGTGDDQSAFGLVLVLAANAPGVCVCCEWSCVLGRPRSEAFLQVPVGRSCGRLGGTEYPPVPPVPLTSPAPPLRRAGVGPAVEGLDWVGEEWCAEWLGVKTDTTPPTPTKWRDTTSPRLAGPCPPRFEGGISWVGWRPPRPTVPWRASTHSATTITHPTTENQHREQVRL